MKTLFLVFLLIGAANAQDLAITGATVYGSPDAVRATGMTVYIRAGKIAAVGKDVKVPTGTQRLKCPDCVVFAGFWNCHVHFTETKWFDAAHQPAAELTGKLQAMVSNAGFTTIVDAASDPENTSAMRKRIEKGEVKGPHIYTGGAGFFPPHALPYYLKDMPPEVQAIVPQPETPAEAVERVQRNFAAGADLVKLFTGSYVRPDKVVPMPLEIVRAAAEVAHQRGALVFAHPSNAEGVRLAMNGGVDVLAHAPDTVDGVDEALLRELVRRQVAMVPTLKLFGGDAKVRAIVAQFRQLGGQLLFGTDTGYLTDYDVSEEFKHLAATGLSFRDVLAMLTTAPAERFGVSDQKGRVAIGMNGDLTVLSADPAVEGIGAFSKVRYAIRNGRVIAGAP